MFPLWYKEIVCIIMRLFRDGELAGYVTHILEALTTIEVPVDPAMKKSLEQQ